MIEYLKTKSVAKQIEYKGSKLDEIIIDTVNKISSLVGSTLGPGGCPVLIERYEHDLPPIVTKDGVTVFRAIGLDSSVAHVIMESMRDVALKTATDAGDGPQPLWSNILTPSGFVKMGVILPGMDICGMNGTIQKVLEVFPKGEKEIIKVTFEQGQEVECCEDHLWSVTTNYGSRKVLAIKDMLHNYKQISANGYFKYRYFVPVTATEFIPTASHPLSPYLVGVLLGDGSLCDSGSIELSMGLPKQHILDKLNLPSGSTAKTTYSEETHSFRTKITNIRHFIDEIGLRNTDSYTKFIPPAYLMGSLKDRHALLRGLLDTDGHTNGRGLFEFSTVSDQMADDFLFLCRSLGIPVYHRVKRRIAGDGSYSSRSIHCFSELKGCKYGLKIKNIQKTGRKTLMQCIKVSNPDNLYVTDNFIVTHNTTSATILAASLITSIKQYCELNKKVSPQKVMRRLDEIFLDVIEPTIKKLSKKVRLNPRGLKMLKAVAKLSANGDEDLASAVMQCFMLTGEEGNVTIETHSGPSSTEVEQIEGYPIGIGFEKTCLNFWPQFINDAGNQQTRLENPVFLLYNGKLTEIQTIMPIMQAVGISASPENTPAGATPFTKNLVVIATGFSDSVLADLGGNFPLSNTINVLPLMAPMTIQQGSEYEFLKDVAAITGSTIFDMLSNPLSNAKLEHLGSGIEVFECGRYRSTIIGCSDEGLQLYRIDEVKQQLKNSISELDKIITTERLAKLSGGIAKLKIYGSSNGETKEKRDRAEDAVCAVRGAVKHGCLPGGAWTLLKVIDVLLQMDREDVIDKILVPALTEPFNRLVANCGIVDEEEKKDIKNLILNGFVEDKIVVYDFLGQRHVEPFKFGILDSTPAVLEAIRNALSIAGRLGTLGGVIVQRRDKELERTEATATSSFLRMAEENPANERL